MAPSKRSGRRWPVSSIHVLLWFLLLILAIAGGASRADALGQAIVRPASAAIGAVLVVMRSPMRWRDHRGPIGLLAAAIAVPLIQLVPLPPAMWLRLPGRDAFAHVAALAGAAQPWRPIAIVPDAALNALGALLVPAAAMALALAFTPRERLALPGAALVFALASALLAVLQVSGAGVDNPLINELPGTATGFFANPNHQALLLSIGILAAAAWAIGDGPRPRAGPRSRDRSGGHWRLTVAAGACLWLVLMILATGSRTGLIMGGIALIVAAIQLRTAAAMFLARLSRRARLTAAGVVLVAAATLVAVSFTAGRAVSLNRLLALSTGEDIRSRALPTIAGMVAHYMPVGIGVGGFDPLFRMHEPDALLGPTYFNHAHDDLLEILLESGVAGLILLVAGLAWVARAAIRAWRADPARSDVVAARFGATSLLLVLLASAFDYPARTPIILAVIAMVAILADPPTGPTRS